jgi:hypothetical protein
MGITKIRSSSYPCVRVRIRPKNVQWILFNLAVGNMSLGLVWNIFVDKSCADEALNSEVEIHLKTWCKNAYSKIMRMFREYNL